MHQPRPHGKFGQEDATRDDLAFAESLMRHVTNIKQTAGLDSFKMVRALPDGGMVVALDMGGIVKTIIRKPKPEVVEDDELAEVSADVPMLFSGIVERTILRGGEKPVVNLTTQTTKRLGGYGAKKKKPEETYSTASRQELERFNIPYGPRFSEFEPKPGAAKHTQYAQLRATWYSGAMAQVVQVVSGYGKSKFDTKPSNPTELAKMVIPEAVRQEIGKELEGVSLPGYTGVPPVSGQIQYDYKFYDSHAVVFGEDNKPWLVQISNLVGGVYAMPLPLVPATTTKAFKKWIKKVGDTEIQWILDTFGGMPSGEPFPRGKQMQAWKRAGVVIKVCDMGDFYTHSMYSSSCGWSFNKRGTEGCATCYDYEENGVAYGLTYTMNISIGKMLFNGKRRDDWKNLDTHDLRRLMGYVSQVLAAAGGNRDEIGALRFKLRNTPASQLVTRSKFASNMKAEAEYWIDHESERIASVSGSVTQTGRGWLHSKLPAMYQPQIKFPEPLLGACLSFNFAPLMHGRQEDPKCDTTMFAYYSGDTLKTVKYFKDPSKSKKLPEDGFTDCMTVGSWEKKEFIGDAGLQGNFYTTDADDRRMTAEQERTTTIVGKDLGYDTQPHFAFDNFFSVPGSLWRHRYFSHDTTTHTATGKSLGIGLCVPYLCRDALLYATKDVTLSATTSKALTLGSVTDPYSYRFWTYDFIHAWWGGLPVMNARPWPKDGNPVWVEMEEYAPGGCSDFADNGPWIPNLPADYTWLIHPNKNEWKHSGGGGPPSFKGSSSSTEAKNVDKRTLSFSFGDLRKILDDADSGYFLASPTDNGFYFSRGATRICAGESVYQNVSEKVNGKNAYSGYTRLADHQSSHCFIGVINE